MADKSNITPEDSGTRPDDIFFECPMCGKAMVVGAEGAGEIVMCPSCDQEVIVPGGPLWDEVTAQMEAEAAAQAEQAASIPQPPELTDEDATVAALNEQLRSLENQLRENETQRAATANSIAQALNQATRFKLTLQRLEEKQRVLESLLEETKRRMAALEQRTGRA